jgi:hypothetical protein
MLCCMQCLAFIDFVTLALWNVHEMFVRYIYSAAAMLCSLLSSAALKSSKYLYGKSTRFVFCETKAIEEGSWLIQG